MALPPGLPPEEAFSSESLLCVLTAATIPCSSRLPGQTHLRAYQHHCLKRPSVQMQSIRKIRPPSTIFISPCDRNDHERLILYWNQFPPSGSPCIGRECILTFFSRRDHYSSVRRIGHTPTSRCSNGSPLTQDADRLLSPRI